MYRHLISAASDCSFELDRGHAPRACVYAYECEMRLVTPLDLTQDHYFDFVLLGFGDLVKQRDGER